MIVKGHVRISLSLNVYDLETDAVCTDKYGNVTISDPDQFFMDWCDNWNSGTGELLGASDDDVDLTYEEEQEW